MNTNNTISDESFPPSSARSKRVNPLAAMLGFGAHSQSDSQADELTHLKGKNSSIENGKTDIVYSIIQNEEQPVSLSATAFSTTPNRNGIKDTPEIYDSPGGSTTATTPSYSIETSPAPKSSSTPTLNTFKFHFDFDDDVIDAVFGELGYEQVNTGPVDFGSSLHSPSFNAGDSNKTVSNLGAALSNISLTNTDDDYRLKLFGDSINTVLENKGKIDATQDKWAGEHVQQKNPARLDNITPIDAINDDNTPYISKNVAMYHQGHDKAKEINPLVSSIHNANRNMPVYEGRYYAAPPAGNPYPYSYSRRSYSSGSEGLAAMYDETIYNPMYNNQQQQHQQQQSNHYNWNRQSSTSSQQSVSFEAIDDEHISIHELDSSMITPAIQKRNHSPLKTSPRRYIVLQVPVNATTTATINNNNNDNNNNNNNNAVQFESVHIDLHHMCVSQLHARRTQTLLDALFNTLNNQSYTLQQRFIALDGIYTFMQAAQHKIEYLASQQFSNYAMQHLYDRLIQLKDVELTDVVDSTKARNQKRLFLWEYTLDHVENVVYKYLLKSENEEWCPFIRSSLDQYGSRVIQSLLDVIAKHLHLDNRWYIMLDKLLNVIADHLITLSTHITGNHVVQKFISIAPYILNMPQSRMFFITPMPNSIVNKNEWNALRLHTDQYACHVMQAVYRYATTTEQLEAVWYCIKLYFVQLATDSFGNYIIQYIIHQAAQKLSSIAKGEIDVKSSEEVALLWNTVASLVKGHLSTLAVNKYASNVIENAIRYAPNEIAQAMIVEILSYNEGKNILSLISDKYGNYVIQAILERCNEEQLRMITKLVHENERILRISKYSCKVVNKLTGKEPKMHSRNPSHGSRGKNSHLRQYHRTNNR